MRVRSRRKEKKISCANNIFSELKKLQGFQVGKTGNFP